MLSHRKTRRSLRFDLLERYFRDISCYPSLSTEEEHDLVAEAYATRDKKFTQKLILCNLKLVVSVALTYHNKHLDLLDLIQEGNLALIQAIQKYSPLIGTPFSAYAFFSIRTRILWYVMNTSARIDISDERDRVSPGSHWAKRRGGEPDLEEVAFAFEATEEDIRTSDKSTSFEMIADPPDDIQGDIEGFWPKENIEEIVAARERIEVLRETVMQFRKRLDERETYILEHRITAPEQPMTLAEIGDHFGISRERVRQLEAAILKRLKIKLRQTIVARTARIRNLPAA